MIEFENFLEKLNTSPTLLDDPDWLSKAVIQLGTLLYNQGISMAKAKFDEDNVATKYMDTVSEAGKKMSVAESEKRATVDTDNSYEQHKLTREAIIETINSIKKRLEVLSWEHKN